MRESLRAQPLRILLIEDNPGDVSLLREMFSTERPCSFELMHLPQLGMAMNYLARGGVDIVLLDLDLDLDLGLPHAAGLDTVRRVRRLAPHVPLIVLTDQEDDAAVVEAMLEGAQDYLVKGQIENRALPRALRHAIERFRLLTKAALTNMELERRVKEKDILLGEIHHRVKNSLQVVSSLLSLESARIADSSVIEMLQSTQNRVRSMALIHQTLYQSKDFGSVDFHAFLESFVPTLIQSYSIHPGQISLSIHIAEVRLPIDLAVPCGLIVNELISNALKHAFPDGRKGCVGIEFVHEADGYATLSVSDDGVGIAEEMDFANAETLGIQLVYLLAGQLGGRVSIQRSMPTRFLLRFPLRLIEQGNDAGGNGVPEQFHLFCARGLRN